jgi:FKBP-type peptidyl-prolyl cis-trans isomerase
MDTSTDEHVAPGPEPTDPPPSPPNRTRLGLIIGGIGLALGALAIVIGIAASHSSSKHSVAVDNGAQSGVGPHVFNPNYPANDPHNLNSHWHAALGVYACDHWMGDQTGNGIWLWPGLSSQGNIYRVGTQTYAGLHSHDDGIIHMEPATADDAGANATVGRYFSEGGWKLSADSFTFLNQSVHNGEACEGQPGKVQWEIGTFNPSGSAPPTYVAKTGDPSKYKLNNFDVVVIAFLPSSKSIATVGDPPSLPNLYAAAGRETSQTPSTVATPEDATGKPCVAENGAAPAGAPAVPVQVGPAPTHLVIRDLKVGTGAVVPQGATVTVQYIGVACSTGKIFDSSYSRGQTATFPLSQVIPGWTQGLPGMRVGGYRLLGIPSEMAYGAQGSPPVIAPNEALWFVVQVTKIG